MREIDVHNAALDFIAVVEDAVRGEAIILTSRGKRRAAVVGYEEGMRLTNRASFGRLLMSAPLQAGDLPDRWR